MSVIREQWCLTLLGENKLSKFKAGVHNVNGLSSGSLNCVRTHTLWLTNVQSYNARQFAIQAYVTASILPPSAYRNRWAYVIATSVNYMYKTSVKFALRVVKIQLVLFATIGCIDELQLKNISTTKYQPHVNRVGPTFAANFMNCNDNPQTHL